MVQYWYHLFKMQYQRDALNGKCVTIFWQNLTVTPSGVNYVSTCGKNAK